MSDYPRQSAESILRLCRCLSKRIFKANSICWSTERYLWKEQREKKVMRLRKRLNLLYGAAKTWKIFLLIMFRDMGLAELKFTPFDIVRRDMKIIYHTDGSVFLAERNELIYHLVSKLRLTFKVKPLRERKQFFGMKLGCEQDGSATMHRKSSIKKVLEIEK